MYNRGKVTGSPSIPRKLKQIIKDRHQVPIAVRTSTDTNDEWTDVHKTSGSTQDWSDVEECSDEVFDFTSEDDYSPVEQLRCEEFTSFDYITDQVVIPSSKSLLDVDSDDFDFFRNANPVASSTQIFPEATLFEDEIHHSEYFKHVKPVNESTGFLPEAPDITDDVDDFKLNNPKASSTLIFPDPSLTEEEIEMMIQLNPLTGCRSVDLSSIATASLPLETYFESDIERTPSKSENYHGDKESNYSMDAIIVPLKNLSLNNSETPKISTKSKDDTIVNLSVRASKTECSISNVDSRSSRNVIGFVMEDLPEEFGSRTNSFLSSFKRSKQILSNIQRKGTITISNLDETKCKRLKDISNQDLKLPTRTSNSTRNDSVHPENQTFLQDVPICCIRNKQGSHRPLKVMKPFYRSDVPIDVLCEKGK